MLEMLVECVQRGGFFQGGAHLDILHVGVHCVLAHTLHLERQAQLDAVEDCVRVGHRARV